VAFPPDEYLCDVLALDREHLNPPAAAIRDIDKSIIRDLDGVHRIDELPRTIRALIGRL